VFWLVSTWNPYLVALLQTNVQPSGAGAPTACARAGRGPRLRWCE
jgi:hypothetical protein